MGSFISALYQFICCCNTNNDIDHEKVEKENSNSSCQTDRPVTPHPNSNTDIFEPRNIINTLSPVKEPEPENGNKCYLSCNHELSQERYKHFVNENNPDEVEHLSVDEKCCDSNECCVTKECCSEDNVCCTEDSKCCNENINDNLENLSDDGKLSDCEEIKEENETDSIILEDPDSVNAFFNDTESLQPEPDNVPLEVDQDITPDISTIPEKEITQEVKEHEDLKEHVDEIIEKVIEENN